jgi:hypothetical protein
MDLEPDPQPMRHGSIPELDDVIGANEVPGPPARDASMVVGEAIAEKLAKRRRLS